MSDKRVLRMTTKERPIIFNDEMVRAILDGRKTQTRRIVKLPVIDKDIGCELYGSELAGSQRDALRHCPHGQPGDRLWVREAFSIGEDLGKDWEPWMEQGDRFVRTEGGHEIYCVPDDYFPPKNTPEKHHCEDTPEHWREFGQIPPIFMPRWASRITLEITGVRVERLNDISEADAKAEGVHGEKEAAEAGLDWYDKPRRAFRFLWQSIYGPGSWDANPWVWVIEFKRV